MWQESNGLILILHRAAPLFYGDAHSTGGLSPGQAKSRDFSGLCVSQALPHDLVETDPAGNGDVQAGDRSEHGQAEHRVAALRDAGCRCIQIEEPTLHFWSNTYGPDSDEVKFMVEAFQRETQGLDDVELWIHTCWGNPNMQRVIENDSYAESFELYLHAMRGDVWTVEMTDRNFRDIELFGSMKGRLPKKVCVGAVSHRNLQVDSPDVGFLNVRAAPHVGADIVAKAKHGAILGGLIFVLLNEAVNDFCYGTSCGTWDTAFGPVATVMGYRDLSHVITLVNRGQGSLVASVITHDPEVAREVVMGAGAYHGRLYFNNRDSMAEAISSVVRSISGASHPGPSQGSLSAACNQVAEPSPQALLPVQVEGGDVLPGGHAGLAHQQGIVFAPPAQDLDRALNFAVATDQRIDLPVLGLMVEVYGELLERAFFLVAAGSLDRLRDPAHLVGRLRCDAGEGGVHLSAAAAADGVLTTDNSM